ncbi:YfcC family protein [Erysipelothrix urinaevulpis]|uniref:YfcC family protein n=1 Tax=Erysipelothrix urinaevulpis TaxID=2683717 RepID=UPI001357921A|nr:YfcC family protein [Erysipelothrix urinaevulpis]
MKKKFKMPSAYTIVAIALVVTAILSYFIPQSVFDKETGKIVLDAVLSDNGQILQGQGMQPFGLWDVLMAPIKGFQASSDVGVGILVAGGFLAVLNKTGALEAGIGELLNKFQGSVLIAIMMFVFALLGTSFGFWEEITAFAVVVVPMFVLAGYDVMTGLAVLFIGSTVGNMASVVNPFSTGAAVSAIGNPELTLGSGIILRSITFLILYVIATAFVLSYANKVKDDKSKSILADLEDVKTLVDQKAEMPEFTKERKRSVFVFVILVFLMIVGFFPWLELTGEAGYNLVNAPFTALAKVPFLGTILGASHVSPFGTWGFNEFAFLFLSGSLILKVINNMSEMEFLDVFLDGLKDLLGVVVVLSIARGIAIIMGDATQGMSITFIYYISNALSSVPLWIFGIFAMAAYVLIGLFLQSTSGVAGISMPILGAVASALFVSSKLGAAGGQIILISAFAAGVNFMSGLYPGATLMGTLELVNVPYDRYLKFTVKILSVLLFAAAIIISIAPYLGLVQ